MDDIIPISKVIVTAYVVPTETPESDGTIEWSKTTIVIVHVSAGGKSGMGYTYTHHSAGEIIRTDLSETIRGKNALDVPALWSDMVRIVRNIGRPGIAACAISAVDAALWDLKAKIMDVPLAVLLGRQRDSIEVYGSGGFTSYPMDKLNSQLSGWVDEGIRMVKMKIGRNPNEDPERLEASRKAIGPSVRLFVDANGAYTPREALHMAEILSDYEVDWFEEPVSSDDIRGLSFLRDRAPAGMDIAAGEYGYNLQYFRDLLMACAVDVLQADATRCLGITGFLKAGYLCEAFQRPFSAHTAPSIHLHPALCLNSIRHVEYFHDHVRLEEMFFDGAALHRNGELSPDLSRPGLGIALKKDAEKYKIFEFTNP